MFVRAELRRFLETWPLPDAVLVETWLRYFIQFVLRIGIFFSTVPKEWVPKSICTMGCVPRSGRTYFLFGKKIIPKIDFREQSSEGCVAKRLRYLFRRWPWETGLADSLVRGYWIHRVQEMSNRIYFRRAFDEHKCIHDWFDGGGGTNEWWQATCGWIVAHCAFVKVNGVLHACVVSMNTFFMVFFCVCVCVFWLLYFFTQAWRSGQQLFLPQSCCEGTTGRGTKHQGQS